MFPGEFAVYRDGLICSAFGAGGRLFARVRHERGDAANNGDDVSKQFHAFKCQAARAPVNAIFLR